MDQTKPVKSIVVLFTFCRRWSCTLL